MNFSLVSREAIMIDRHPRWRHAVGAAAVAFAISAASAMTSSAQAPAAAAGSSVWAGVYTDGQSKRGEDVAGKLCTSCHGPLLEGGEAGPALVGLEFLSNWNSLSLADLYDRVQSTMPADAPGTMTPQQTSDVMSYVLKLNKYPAGQAELASDPTALKNVKIEAQQPAK
jgi:mono/diheme cytochrome c family protein